MASTADIRKGMCLDYKNDLYTIVDFQHVKPGKGGAFVRTKLKSVTTGKVIENTFNSGETIFPVQIQRRKYQFLYKDVTGYSFMDQNSFEQITLEQSQIDTPEFLKEGQEVEVTLHADTEKPLFCELPDFVVLKIKYSEPGVKGDTANNPMKQATLETGSVINVPMFVNEGENIRVDTRSRSYVERVKA